MESTRQQCDWGRVEWVTEKGTLHRVGGPAVEKNGTKKWYRNGKLHRTDGPAVEWKNGDKEWWINGEELTEQEFLERGNG